MTRDFPVPADQAGALPDGLHRGQDRPPASADKPNLEQRPQAQTSPQLSEGLFHQWLQGHVACCIAVQAVVGEIVAQLLILARHWVVEVEEEIAILHNKVAWLGGVV